MEVVNVTDDPFKIRDWILGSLLGCGVQWGLPGSWSMISVLLRVVHIVLW